MKRRSEEKIETPITSMIDITFLLIIFFVVTADFDRETVDTQIKLAKSYSVEPPEGRDPKQITINVRYENKKGENRCVYSIGGTGMGLEQLQAVLSNARATHGTSVPVIIRASSDAPFRKVDEVIAIVGRSGLFKVSMASEVAE
jgi:biopolymer transport protein ExbD